MRKHRHIWCTAIDGLREVGDRLLVVSLVPVNDTAVEERFGECWINLDGLGIVRDRSIQIAAIVLLDRTPEGRKGGRSSPHLTLLLNGAAQDKERDEDQNDPEEMPKQIIDRRNLVGRQRRWEKTEGLVSLDVRLGEPKIAVAPLHAKNIAI